MLLLFISLIFFFNDFIPTNLDAMDKTQIFIVDEGEGINKNTDFSDYIIEEIPLSKAKILFDKIEEVTNLTGQQKKEIIEKYNKFANPLSDLPIQTQDKDEPKKIFKTSHDQVLSQDFFQDCKDFFLTNKYALLVTATGLSIYCYIRWQLYYLSHSVYFKNSWSCWRDEIPLEILYDMKQEEVRDALSIMINETYKTKEKNLSDPLLIFKKDISYEMECLQKFINFYRFLKRTFLSYIFPSYEKAFKKAQEKIDRLMYLEELIEDTMHEKYMI